MLRATLHGYTTERLCCNNPASVESRAFENKQDPICYDFVDDIGYLVKSYKKDARPSKTNATLSRKEVHTSHYDVEVFAYD